MAPELLYSASGFQDSQDHIDEGASGFIPVREQSWLREQGYQIVCVLASGSNGTVFRAVATETGLPVALKAVPISNLTSNERGRLRLEIFTLKKTRHRNIVKFIDALESDNQVYIVTELMIEDLFERTSRKNLNESEAIEVSRQVLSALKYLHKRGVYHRDLKLENIMIASDPTQSYDSGSHPSSDSDEYQGRLWVKIVDFGGAYMAPRPALHNEELVLTPSPMDGFGTTFYLPPEVVRREEYSPEAVDVWGLGVVLYSAITGHFPFFGNSNPAIYEMICKRRPNFEEVQWRSVSSEFKSFIRDLLCKDPVLRTRVDQALRLVVGLGVDETVEAMPASRTKRERRPRSGRSSPSPAANKKKGLRSNFFQRKRLEPGFVLF